MEIIRMKIFRPKLSSELNLLFSFLALVVILLPSTAAATGFITPGSQRASTGGTIGVTAGTEFQIYLEAGRSYACTVIPADSTTTLAISSDVMDPDGDTITVNQRGDYTPIVTAPTGTAAEAMRVTLTPTKDGLHKFTVSTATGTEVVRPECVETTLYGGYNTNVNDFNFLELTNTTNREIRVRITATNFNGDVVINNQEAVIPANRRVDVDIHSAAGNNVFGGLKVTTNGPLGGVLAFLSQYSGTVTDFSLSVSLRLQTRDRTL